MNNNNNNNNNNGNNNNNNEEAAAASSSSSAGNNNNNGNHRKNKRKHNDIVDNNSNNNEEGQEEEENTTIEISRSEMLAKFLTDEQLLDVVLVGSDSIQVKANRCVLSSRSQVFRQMLLGNFKEASDSIIKIGYPGRVLKTIVEYICTDSAELFQILLEGEVLLSFEGGEEEEGKEGQSRSKKVKAAQHDDANVDGDAAMDGEAAEDSSSSKAIATSAPAGMKKTSFTTTNDNDDDDDFKNLISTLVSVADAAAYFQLPGLTKKIQNVVTQVGKDRGTVVSLMFLDACHSVGLVNVPPRLQQTILKTVRCPPTSGTNRIINFDHYIDGLRPDTLESILQDKYVEWSELDFYNLVAAWVNGTVEGIGNENTTGDRYHHKNEEGKSTEEEYKMRVQIAKTRFVQHIRFQNIDPHRLANTVSTSGFVDNALLFDAYKAQALAAATFHFPLGEKINTSRYQPWTDVLPTANINADDVIAIKIQNAGIAHINGIYQRKGQHLGVAKYVMPITSYQGRPRESWIMLTETRTSSLWWFIFLIDEEQPGTDRDVAYYGVLQDQDRPQIPPRTGWKVVHDNTPADSPLPELFYNLKEENLE